jgi:hypothetical protein
MRVSGALSVGLGSLAIACGDPVHDDAVSALGGETSGVPVGPLHRPGQPCATCHAAAGPAQSEFSIGGTVYLLSRQDAPAVGALVEIIDVTGAVFAVTSNEAGNFWIPLDTWTPTFPYRAKVTLGGVTKQMIAHVTRSRSCADCHLSPPGPRSPGHIYLATNPGDLTPAP